MKKHPRKPSEQNPNIEASEELHRQHPELGGLPAGENEGSEAGSRGDNKRRHSRHLDIGGSRTSKK